MDPVAELRSIVGPAGLPEDTAAYETDWRGAYSGRALAVVAPSSTEQVAAVVRLCHEHQVALVPQGGNTGLCGGAVPDPSGGQVVLSLTRMRRTRAVDPQNLTIAVDAGVVLADVQRQAADHGRFFPLSLGAEGTATVGGLLATNAGGTAVLRYGTMRDLTLGVEAVLPDGRIWDGMRALRKDNTGYDLKQLFIGAEGTLGVITGAVLKLFAAPRHRSTAWVALADPQAAVDLLDRCQEEAGDRLTGFELMSRQSVDVVLAHVPGARDPFPAGHPWYALLEVSDTAEVLERVLAAAFEHDLVADAVVADGRAQTAALWALREGISEAQNHEGPSLKHDVTVPISAIPAFVARTDAALTAALPGIRMVTYGHVGDGNLHYNLSGPPGTPDAAFTARAAELTRVVYDTVHAFDGSISAEHGLGQSKPHLLADYKDPVALDLMRTVKRALDPTGLMNPGKVLP